MLSTINFKIKKTILSIEKRIYWKTHLKSALETISLFKKTHNRSIEAIIDFSFSYSGQGFFSSLGLLQNRLEILNFCKLLEKKKPKNICEIGTFKGGTLFLWSQIANNNAKIISIDLPGGPFGGGYNRRNIRFFESFLSPKQKLVCLRGDSSSKDIKDQFKSEMGADKLDFLFIDGDHTYKGVKKDFKNYSPFVKKGGMIGFHDILHRKAQKNIEVYKYWNELKKIYRHKEFIDKKSKNRPIGIGLIYTK